MTTTRETRTAGFRAKNILRKATRTTLLAEQDGERRYLNARTLRRNHCVGGAFGNLEGHDFNEYALGTSAEPKTDEGDAEG